MRPIASLRDLQSSALRPLASLRDLQRSEIDLQPSTPDLQRSEMRPRRSAADLQRSTERLQPNLIRLKQLSGEFRTERLRLRRPMFRPMRRPTCQKRDSNRQRQVPLLPRLSAIVRNPTRDDRITTENTGHTERQPIASNREARGLPIEASGSAEMAPHRRSLPGRLRSLPYEVWRFAPSFQRPASVREPETTFGNRYKSLSSNR
jgi:hypothetical protein